LPALLERCDLGIDVGKLRIAIGMGGAFLGLPVPLETLCQIGQQFGDLLAPNLMALSLQLRCQLPHTLARPT
jgi:hypothetical protein